MTFDELLKCCVNGMPMVLFQGKSGRVTVIKNNRSFKGCAVEFENGYDEWFYSEPGTDKRKKYMKDLTPTNKQPL